MIPLHILIVKLQGTEIEYRKNKNDFTQLVQT